MALFHLDLLPPSLLGTPRSVPSTLCPRLCKVIWGWGWESLTPKLSSLL